MIEILILILSAVLFCIFLIKNICIVLKIVNFNNNQEKHIEKQAELVEVTHKLPADCYYKGIYRFIRNSYYKGIYRFFDDNGVEHKFSLPIDIRRKEDAKKNIKIYYDEQDASVVYDEMIVKETLPYLYISISLTIGLVIIISRIFYLIFQ